MLLDTVVEGNLVGVSVLEEFSHSLVDIYEIFRLFWELFLYLFGVDEEILEETPRSLDLINEHNDLTDGSETLLPVDDLVLKGGEIS